MMHITMISLLFSKFKFQEEKEFTTGLLKYFFRFSTKRKRGGWPPPHVPSHLSTTPADRKEKEMNEWKERGTQKNVSLRFFHAWGSQSVRHRFTGDERKNEWKGAERGSDPRKGEEECSHSWHFLHHEMRGAWKTPDQVLVADASYGSMDTHSCLSTPHGNEKKRIHSRSQQKQGINGKEQETGDYDSQQEFRSMASMGITWIHGKNVSNDQRHHFKSTNDDLLFSKWTL